MVGYLHDALVGQEPHRTDRPAVVVFPGGGYAFCSDREADPVALPFFEKGYQVFIVFYPVLADAAGMRPLIDVSLSLMAIRSHAAEWAVDADRIAVCISPKRCAVDIEPASRDFSRAESRYTTPSERALSDDPLWPGIVWCAKEALYKYSGRRELDFRKDLRIGSADLAAGRLTGRIENGEPVELSVRREDGFILVCIL